ncbi:MFS transporter [Limnochorda pilosa]|uniref:Major facilitator superfamily MFS_1 n=1 Tax=Limnochorda pilosa TaxID=1555112 RepID=A0A0K2SJ80_LIMPI|nr:MFS transporter [Limnochorda pilosa]BAS27171.1 Major facilitator superfamily MFS_1 [Limnochorda pilosa]
MLGMAFLDELISGFPVVALPLIRDDLSLSYTQVGLLFTAGQVSSAGRPSASRRRPSWI